MEIGINKVWGFLAKNPTKKSAKYLLSDSMTALVRHSQAKKMSLFIYFITGQTAPAGFAQGTEFVPNNYNLHTYNQ